MKYQNGLNKSDQNNTYITEVLSYIDFPERQLSARELLQAFEKNLEMIRDNYLQLTEAEFYLEDSEALEQKKHL